MEVCTLIVYINIRVMLNKSELSILFIKSE
jgi:hypothetical protein